MFAFLIDFALHLTATIVVAVRLGLSFWPGLTGRPPTRGRLAGMWPLTAMMALPG
ncbi:hypothetical protein H4696_000784 [Amycolatopsis lexingtonensis]|uniref:Uncharacterized protein n=1 Tax=Amycolatopsis lexingtonensis TaxID=218822 RepID=A0ABR9HRY4_9PSEU|nr:hypothetical protein [Amycolatopsis lexingtonensis]MBE1493684.1 hypothetical protein [Amycolatopsis lexingtonensis]